MGTNIHINRRNNTRTNERLGSGTGRGTENTNKHRGRRGFSLLLQAPTSLEDQPFQSPRRFGPRSWGFTSREVAACRHAPTPPVSAKNGLKKFRRMPRIF